LEPVADNSSKSVAIFYFANIVNFTGFFNSLLKLTLIGKIHEFIAVVICAKKFVLEFFFKSEKKKVPSCFGIA